MDNDAYVGVLDTCQNNIYFHASAAGKPAEVSVAYWTWLKIKDAVYEWEFELLLGSEPYANAMLRAAYPATKDNRSQETVKGPFTYRANRNPETSGQYGIAAHYYPGGGEYHRAGLYFDPRQDFDQLYDTQWSTIKKDYRRSYPQRRLDAGTV